MEEGPPVRTLVLHLSSCICIPPYHTHAFFISGQRAFKKKNTCTIRLKNVQHYIAYNAMVDFKPLKAYALKQFSKLI